MMQDRAIIDISKLQEIVDSVYSNGEGRYKLKLTVRDCCVKVGFSEHDLCLMAKGKSIQMRKAEMLSRYLEVTVDAFARRVYKL